MKRRIPAAMLVKWPSDRLSDRPGLVDRVRQYAVGAGLAAAARTARAAAVAAQWSSRGVCSCGSSSIGYSLLHSTEAQRTPTCMCGRRGSAVKALQSSMKAAPSPFSAAAPVAPGARGIRVGSAILFSWPKTLRR